MATEPHPQRAYRAACPNCGAPVEFRSAASAFAVCSFCKSTVLREGDALRKIGESADLFDDHTPLQLGASGQYQGAPFTLVGRLQYRYAEGTWNEWHALFDGGNGSTKSAWLSEDNGRYVMAFDAPLDVAKPPAPEALRAGAQLLLAQQFWSVASVTTAHILAAQGELPRPPELKAEFTVADLRNTRGEVATLDYSTPASPQWSVGQSVALTELRMTGLADAGGAAAEKTLKGRAVECPSCGTALTLTLSTTQSIVCTQCHAVVDVSQGAGGDLSYYAQHNALEPLIPLGRSGILALGGAKPLPWQVVGYVERCEVPDSAEDEQSYWREYLLYNRSEGFAFLVDAQDGWSWSAPITGVPQMSGQTSKAMLDGVTYRKLYDYTGKVTYVLGEFYWRLTRDQLTRNSDYQGTGSGAAKRLNREVTGEGPQREIVWSRGETLSADAVLKAFGLAGDQRAALQRDALPAALGFGRVLTLILYAVLGVTFLLLLLRCSSQSSDCSDTRATFGEASQEYQNCLARQRSGGWRTGGGSFGGYSSGGGHK